MLPQYCVVCLHAIDSKNLYFQFNLCDACSRLLPWAIPGCRRCQQTLPQFDDIDVNLAPRVCGHCLRQPPLFSELKTVFYYSYPVNHLVRALKFKRRLAVARFLGLLMAERIATQQTHVEAIIPVPLHPVRLAERGFNQAFEIARTIVQRHPHLNLLDQGVERLTPTPAQSGLNAQQRFDNMKNVFITRGKFQYRHVAIVDDVVSTMATVNSLAACLLKTGVATVNVWCACRNLPREVIHRNALN